MVSATRAQEPLMRVAVIGHTGRGNFGHGLDTMWKDVPGARLVAVADADAKGLAAAQAKLGLERGYGDYRQMLREDRPEIVAIGPRHVDQHHEMVLAAVEAGARGIYMEKPFCRTLAEADDIVDACARRGVRLALCSRNRYHPALPVAMRMIKSGKSAGCWNTGRAGRRTHEAGRSISGCWAVICSTCSTTLPARRKAAPPLFSRTAGPSWPLISWRGLKASASWAAMRFTRVMRWRRPARFF